MRGCNTATVTLTFMPSPRNDETVPIRGQELRDRIEQAAKAKGYASTTAFAEAHGLQMRNLTSMQGGASPELGTIERWADALGYAPIDLLVWGKYDQVAQRPIVEPPSPLDQLRAALKATPELTPDSAQSIIILYEALVGGGAVVGARRKR